MTVADKQSLDALLRRDNKDGIDPTGDPDIDTLLRDIQGNILKSHGRDRGTHLFIRFGDPVAGRRWLALMAARVTSAHRQWKDTAKRAEGMAEAEQLATDQEIMYAKSAVRARSSAFVNLLLSASGYDVLGLERPGDDHYFERGAKNTVDDFRDPPWSQWQSCFQQRIDAVVMVAEDDVAKVEAEVKELLTLLADNGAGTEIFRQHGVVTRIDNEGQRSLDGPPREPFGFLDGITDPLFFKKDIDKLKARSCKDHSAPLSLVLVKEPDGRACGSYVVYRKLRQHIDRFNETRKLLAGKLKEEDGTQDDEYYHELAGAYLVGRFPDGTPVVKQDKPGGCLDDCFDYSADTDGMRCPPQAHIRKTNPRGHTGEPNRELSRRIVRRGTSYDETRSDGAGTDGAGIKLNVGLLFVCMQASIKDQFAFMQDRWSNWDDFPVRGTGPDSLIGQVGAGTAIMHQWPAEYGDDAKRKIACPAGGNHPTGDAAKTNLVELMGAEYFFAPSLQFLRSCAAQQP